MNARRLGRIPQNAGTPRGRIRIFDWPGKRRVAELAENPTAVVVGLCFSPDGTMLYATMSSLAG